MTVSGVMPPFVTISKSGICHGKWLREDVGKRVTNLLRRRDERDRLVTEFRRQLIDDGRQGRRLQSVLTDCNRKKF